MRSGLGTVHRLSLWDDRGDGSWADERLIAALDGQQISWDSFCFTLDAVTSSAGNSDSLRAKLEEQSDDLVQKADAVAHLYETAATAKVNRLRAIQVTFLAGALALLAVSAWLTRRSLLKPLRELSLTEKRAQGSVDGMNTAWIICF